MAKQTAVRRISEATAHGAEPEGNQTFGSSSEANFSNYLNWYSWKQTQDNALGMQWLSVRMNELGFDAKDIAAVKRSGLTHLSSSTFSIARMASRGCTFSSDVEDRWNNQVDKAIEHGRTLREEVVVKQKQKDNRSPAQRNLDRARSFIGDIDELYDAVWEEKMEVGDINFFDLFEKLDMKPGQAAILAQHYKRELDEMIEMSSKAYRDKHEIALHDLAMHKTLTKFCEERQAALEGWAVGRSKVRASKKKEEKKTRKIANVSSLKFKKNDDELKLVSIDPLSIVGATTLVMFNTKYRQLTILRAASADGLSIKGTTILNIDPQSSEAKRAGREHSTIREMVNANKTQLAKLFNSIKSSKIEVRSRTSDEVLLIKAIK